MQNEGAIRARLSAERAALARLGRDGHAASGSSAPADGPPPAPRRCGRRYASGSAQRSATSCSRSAGGIEGRPALTSR